MYRRNNCCCACKVTRLVVKEDVWLENLQDTLLFDATEEERVIWHDAPTLESVQRPLVRGRVSRGDQRNTQAILVRVIGLPLSLFRRLNMSNANKELLKWSGTMRLHHVLNFVLMKLAKVFRLLHHGL